ncbi:ATP-binding protein [Mesorhizobium retamae]|uniref:ATP-binding protein n=1 Tax=Mesorhizobium retamae TaxID=2912854 RepID=A0ABS9QI38_9HYPH|nr:ATP-binding protein [Mesorhizobium sp. IRAMC:0171]MCG7507094.1 ATP-binding protein [Mesorhizobium sp. IRAMC:0171]
MAISLSSLNSTRAKAKSRAPLLVIYGVDGVGKTTLAAEFPDAIYLPTTGERAPAELDLPTPGDITSMDDLWNVVGELLDRDENGNLTHNFKTAIIDSLDGLEPLIWARTCARIGVSSIEEPGFGKGYVEADVEWNEYLDAVTDLTEAGITVVQLAHPGIVQFNSPISDPYSRYEIKLHKRAASLVREKADVVGFVNYRISLIKADPKKTNSPTHAEGGNERNIHLNEKAGFVAKNRFSMPDSIRYRKGEGYTELSKFFPHLAAA